MRKTLLLIYFLTIFFNVSSQTYESEVTLFETTEDFLLNKKLEVNAIAVIKQESDNHLWIKKIIEVNSKKKIKRGLSAWAVQKNGINYFNLGYSDVLNNWNVYVKFDIVGKYCAIFIDDNTPYVIKNGGMNTNMGLAGVLLAESAKINKGWKDVNNNKRKILFIDTSELSPKILNRNRSSLGNFLTRNKLEKIIKDSHPNVEIDELPFEKIVEIINELNS